MRKGSRASLGRALSLDLWQALDGWDEGDGSLHERLGTSLADAVERDDLPAGTRLPPERVLATELGIARGTVSAAYELLQRRGLVDRRQGRGTHVIRGDTVGVDARAAALATSLQRNLLFRRLGEPSPDTIDLLGSSAPPSPAIREALAEAAATVDIRELTLSHGYFPLGYPPLRQAIADHLTAHGLPSSGEEILVTGGAQQGISLFARSCASHRGVVVMEDPTYPGAIDVFRTVGARILPVPVCRSDADVELLERTVVENRVSAVYLMPTFHNPTGSVMPDQARRELVRFARATELPIVEDDTLAELVLGPEPPRPLAAYARNTTIVSIGSFSKICWAGLRVGWVRAPRPTIVQLGRLKAVADLGTSLPSQAIAVNLLVRSEYVRACRCRELETRLTLLEELLGRYLPEWEWRRPQGGLSLWVRLPDGSSTELAQIAHRRGVSIAPGSVMSTTGRFDEFVRLSFDHEEVVLEEAIRRLAGAWKAYRRALASIDSSRLDVVV
ncbi:MAG: PLP-dependent aminotransferase family protein [Gaiellaceae bacterium]